MFKVYEVVLDFSNIPDAHQGEVTYGFFPALEAVHRAEDWEYVRGLPARVEVTEHKVAYSI